MSSACSRRSFVSVLGISSFTSILPSSGNMQPSIPKTIRTIPMIETHRGLSGVYPENTLASFQAAIDLGVDRIEMDLHLTKDNEVVILHDDTLERTTNGNGPVDQKTLEEIKKLDAGSWKDEKFKGERVPTLKEVLKLAKDKVMVNLDIKTAAVIKPAIAELHSMEMLRQTIITGCHEDWVVIVQQEEPSIPIFLEHSDSYKKVGEDTGFNIAETGIGVALKHRLKGLCWDDKDVNPNLVRSARQHGISVLVWTVDDPVRIKELLSWGVDGIMSNYADRVLSALNEGK